MGNNGGFPEGKLVQGVGAIAEGRGTRGAPMVPGICRHVREALSGKMRIELQQRGSDGAHSTGLGSRPGREGALPMAPVGTELVLALCSEGLSYS